MILGKIAVKVKFTFSLNFVMIQLMKFKNEKPVAEKIIP